MAADQASEWQGVAAALARLLDGLGYGEVVEVAAGDRLILEVGRVDGELWVLVSGPATPEERLRDMGFRPPDEEKLSWWYAVDLPAASADLRLAANQAVRVLRHLDGVASPADLVWAPVVAGAETQELAAGLGIPRRTFAG